MTTMKDLTLGVRAIAQHTRGTLQKPTKGRESSKLNHETLGQTQ